MNTESPSADRPRMTVSQLMSLCASGDSAATNILDMIDEGTLTSDDEERFAELYAATQGNNE